MITSAKTLCISYEELESMFIKALEKEINKWKEEKEDFLKDPFNTEGRVTGKYMPAPSFQIWLKLPKNTVDCDIIDELIDECNKAGWDIKPKWQEDERTGVDKLYILVNKMN